MSNHKNTVIVSLVIVIIVLVAFIGFQALRSNLIAQQQSIFNTGVQQGQLLEQRNILEGIIQTGSYTIPVIDENNETQQVILGIVQPQSS
jgi:hypothetical protein|tara:strand:- start:292 stop:561 length:270 start_codon:yes stop_codon:yes gene_type:complete